MFNLKKLFKEMNYIFMPLFENIVLHLSVDRFVDQVLSAHYLKNPLLGRHQLSILVHLKK